MGAYVRAWLWIVAWVALAAWPACAPQRGRLAEPVTVTADGRGPADSTAVVWIRAWGVRWWCRDAACAEVVVVAWGVDAKYEWDLVHDPEIRLPGGRDDDEAESVLVGSEIAVGYDRDFVYYASDDASERLLCLTPAGERYLLPAGATGIFYHARGGESAAFGEGALIGYFLPEAGEPGSEVASYGHIGGRLLRAWYSADGTGGRSFGGYAEKFGDGGLGRRGEFFVPYGEADASGLAVTVPRVEGCEVVVYRGAVEAAYHSAGGLVAVLDAGAPFAAATAGLSAGATRYPYFGRDCLDAATYCREAFRGHPYLSGGGDPLSRAVREDPCLLKGVYHVEWRDYPESAWMSDLKDVFAGLLAVGFTPAVMAAGAPVLLEVSVATGTAKASSAAVAMALDASIQTGVHYYFPEGGTEVTWPEAAERVSLTQVGFTGLQSLLEVKDKRAEFMIQAVSDCLFSGYVDEHGGLREAFSGEGCATAVATQSVVFAITKGSGAAWRRLKGLPRAELARGLLRVLPPGEIGGPQVAAMPGLGLPAGARLWLYRQVRGDALDADDVRALFDLGEGSGLADDVAARMAGVLSEPSADEALRAALTVDDWWAQLRGALTADERMGLLEELLSAEDGVGLAAALRQDGELIDAWKALIKFPVLRRNVGALRAKASPKGSRPDPVTYLGTDYVAEHLGRFEDGVVRFGSRKALAQYGTLGPDGGFVMSKLELDDLLDEAKGDLRIIESRLGLDQGYLDGDDVMVILIEDPKPFNLRMPDGNEGGANEYWIPGGKTSGGVSEAVMDFSGKPPFLEINFD